MMESVVQAEGLSKVFRDFWWRPKVRAVSDVSFHIEAGQVFGLLGPNGSGKSTTLKMMLGLLHPSAGAIRVFGRRPSDVQTKRRIGYLPEESYLYPYLTSEETLHFYGRLFRLSAGERRRRVRELLEMIGLEHARGRRVGEFSKGMARRIGLAQAMINDPDLIILDEPTSGLDPIGCRQVKDIITALARRGKTVLLSSHLLADVEDVCDRIAILYNGQIRAEGDIKTLLEQKTQNQVTFPEVDAETMRRIVEALRAALRSEPDVSHPRKTLEQYFLDVVEQARGGPEAPSGASPFGRLAPFIEARNPAEQTP